MLTGDLEIHTSGSPNRTSIRALIACDGFVVDMARRYLVIRVSVEVQVVCRSTALDTSFAHFGPTDALRVRLEASVAVFDGEGDGIWRAVAEGLEREARVAGWDAARIAGALTRVTGDDAGVG